MFRTILLRKLFLDIVMDSKNIQAYIKNAESKPDDVHITTPMGEQIRSKYTRLSYSRYISSHILSKIKVDIAQPIQTE